MIHLSHPIWRSLDRISTRRTQKQHLYQKCIAKGEKQVARGSCFWVIVGDGVVVVAAVSSAAALAVSSGRRALVCGQICATIHRRGLSSIVLKIGDLEQKFGSPFTQNEVLSEGVTRQANVVIAADMKKSCETTGVAGKLRRKESSLNLLTAMRLIKPMVLLLLPNSN
ncbi:hypothetical protein TcWFU_001349 [Taenia crassiceps]|uniref:Uncharacterized protein n=1 Tax=Taenia crassiceps TaxID=6207 RepID=A0ABR4QFC4_9CEST